jgi:thiamine kinase-like enzyme
LRQIGERLRTAIHAFGLPLVFSHNDLLGANIIHDPETGAIHFIDYEYAGMNFQLHDFGNLFWDYNGGFCVN